MNFPFNFIIIPAVIIATAVVGSRYVKQGFATSNWYKELKKPQWTPSGKLIREIWTFLYIITAAAVLWYWNVPVFSNIHYLVAGILLVNAYLNATWNKTFFVNHNLERAFNEMNIITGTSVVAAIIIFFASPIATFLMLPYIIWVIIATILTKQIIKLNSKKLQK